MSYKKAIKHEKACLKNKRKGRNQYMGFTTLASNERRKTPILGSAWFEEPEEKRIAFIAAWKAETEKMLKENPNLVLVD